MQESKFGFQGQEKLELADLYSFELRNYDTKTGLWTTPDPYMQHPSPYTAMSNNPVNNIDPDGGWDSNTIHINRQISGMSYEFLFNQFSVLENFTKYEYDGKVIAETEDGCNETVVIYEEKISQFMNEFLDAQNNGNEDDLDLNERWRSYGLNSKLSGAGMLFIGDAPLDNNPIDLDELKNSLSKDKDKSYMSGALVISGALLADDATVVGTVDDIAILFILGGAFILDKVLNPSFQATGNDNYPGPWSTERPNNYIPKTPMGSGNHNIPNGAKWIVGGVLGYKLYKKWSDTVNPKIQTAPVDNTYYYIPTPPRIVNP